MADVSAQSRPPAVKKEKEKRKKKVKKEVAAKEGDIEAAQEQPVGPGTTEGDDRRCLLFLHNSHSISCRSVKNDPYVDCRLNVQNLSGSFQPGGSFAVRDDTCALELSGEDTELLLLQLPHSVSVISLRLFTCIAVNFHQLGIKAAKKHGGADHAPVQWPMAGGGVISLDPRGNVGSCTDDYGECSSPGR